VAQIAALDPLMVTFASTIMVFLLGSSDDLYAMATRRVHIGYARLSA
jgi:hypothetical protein